MRDRGGTCWRVQTLALYIQTWRGQTDRFILDVKLLTCRMCLYIMSYNPTAVINFLLANTFLDFFFSVH